MDYHYLITLQGNAEDLERDSNFLNSFLQNKEVQTYNNSQVFSGSKLTRLVHFRGSREEVNLFEKSFQSLDSYVSLISSPEKFKEQD